MNGRSQTGDLQRSLIPGVSCQKIGPCQRKPIHRAAHRDAIGLIAFPSGIYYGFVLGVTGAAGGFLSRTYSLRKGTSAAAIIIGLIDAGICLLSFHGLNTLYSSLNDPVLGPEITEFVLGILRQYGVSPEVFVSVMQP